MAVDIVFVQEAAGFAMSVSKVQIEVMISGCTSPVSVNPFDFPAACNVLVAEISTVKGICLIIKSIFFDLDLDRSK